MALHDREDASLPVAAMHRIATIEQLAALPDLTVVINETPERAGFDGARHAAVVYTSDLDGERRVRHTQNDYEDNDLEPITLPAWALIYPKPVRQPFSASSTRAHLPELLGQNVAGAKITWPEEPVNNHNPDSSIGGSAPIDLADVRYDGGNPESAGDLDVHLAKVLDMKGVTDTAARGQWRRALVSVATRVARFGPGARSGHPTSPD